MPAERRITDAVETANTLTHVAVPTVHTPSVHSGLKTKAGTAAVNITRTNTALRDSQWLLRSSSWAA